MSTCKDCLHIEVCKEYHKMFWGSKSLVDSKIDETEPENCQYFKDRSRFVELQTAHWIRHSPDKNIMREFHKQGIGRGMGENSIFWTCSNCESWGNLSFKYCPSCGAKIEEAEQALKEHEK